MKPRDFCISNEGYEAAKSGKGLSDCPYGGSDAFTWRQGVRRRLDFEDGSPDESQTNQHQKGVHS